MEQQVNAAETANTDTENPNTDVLRVTSDFIGRGAMAYGTVTDLKILNMVLESGKHAKNPDSPDCVATSSIRYMIPG